MEHVARISRDNLAEDNIHRKQFESLLLEYHKFHSSYKSKQDNVDMTNRVTTSIGKEAVDLENDEKSLDTTKGVKARESLHLKPHIRTISRLFNWKKPKEISRI